MAKYQVREGDTPDSKITVMLPGDTGGGVYNTEELITESGDWIAPVTGWYDVYVQAGGHAGNPYYTSSSAYASGGLSGRHIHRLLYFNAGDIVPIIIGVGGSRPTATSKIDGGPTYFGELCSNDEETLMFGSGVVYFNNNTAYANIQSYGGGYGGGFSTYPADRPANTFMHYDRCDGKVYGAGGGAFVQNNGFCCWGAGAPGVVYIKYYDPTKF